MKAEFSRFTLILPVILAQVVPGFTDAQTERVPDYIGVVQSHLKTDEVMLEYFLTDSSVQVNAIAKESTFLATQSLDESFWLSLKSFRKKLKSAEPRDFLKSGETLYLFLIRPLRDFLQGRHRLIIIPDDRLSGLPFEAFIRRDSLTACNNLCNLHYLIHDFEVVYHCSRACWHERALTRDAEHVISPDDFQFAFMGFSPEFTKDNHLNALPGSKCEITEIGALFRQKGLSSCLVVNEYSAKDYFKEIACRGRIVHLATHFIPDKTGKDMGGFLFWGYDPLAEKSQPSAGLLTTEEIKDLRLEADLIVLNACASGGNGMKPGFPRNSVPELFFTAGASNILATLWNVTDNLARYFMLDFYRSWLSGKTYSEALREVKLQWINCSSTTIPTIWAPYVLMGE